MKCKEIQEQEKINMKLHNKKKVEKLKEKGITLIALVVTIIILLILAGVTLNMALSGDGLFNMARKAATDYNQQSVEEKLQILYAEKIMEDNDSNTKVKTDVTDVLEEMSGGDITEEKIEEFNKLLEQYNEKVKGIKTAEELGKIGKEKEYPIDGVYVQLSDIDEITDQIGTYEQPFKGVYNGNGKSIRKLSLTVKEDYTGMFRVNEGTVKNVTIGDCQITSEKGAVGGIVGFNKGVIEKCTVSNGGIEAAENDVGGICGICVGGTIESSTNNSSVSGFRWVGGIVGQSVEDGSSARSSINNCENSGGISVYEHMSTEDNIGFGGIVGRLHTSDVKGCVNNGSVSGSTYDTGGIVGLVIEKAVVENSFNYGEVRGERYVRWSCWDDC